MPSRPSPEMGRRPEVRETRNWISDSLKRKLMVLFVAKEFFASGVAEAVETANLEIGEDRIEHVERIRDEIQETSHKDIRQMERHEKQDFYESEIDDLDQRLDQNKEKRTELLREFKGVPDSEKPTEFGDRLTVINDEMRVLEQEREKVVRKFLRTIKIKVPKQDRGNILKKAILAVDDLTRIQSMDEQVRDWISSHDRSRTIDELPDTFEQKRPPRVHLDLDVDKFWEMVEKYDEEKVERHEQDLESDSTRRDQMTRRELKKEDRIYKPTFEQFVSDDFLRYALFSEIRAGSSVDAIISLDELTDHVKAEKLIEENDKDARETYLSIIEQERDAQVLDLMKIGVQDVEKFVASEATSEIPETETFYKTDRGIYLDDDAFERYEDRRIPSPREEMEEELLSVRLEPSLSAYESLKGPLEKRVRDALQERMPDQAEELFDEEFEGTMREVIFKEWREKGDPLGMYVDLEFLKSTLLDLSTDTDHERKIKLEFRSLIKSEMSRAVRTTSRISTMFPQYLAVDATQQVKDRLKEREGVIPEWISSEQERVAGLSWDKLFDERKKAERTLQEFQATRESPYSDRDSMILKLNLRYLSDLDFLLEEKKGERRDYFRGEWYKRSLDRIVISEDAESVISELTRKDEEELQILHGFEQGVDPEFQAENVVVIFDSVRDDLEGKNSKEIITSVREFLVLITLKEKQSLSIRYEAKDLLEIADIFLEDVDRVPRDKIDALFLTIADFREAAEFDSVFYSQLDRLSSIKGFENSFSTTAQEIVRLEKDVGLMLEKKRKEKRKQLSLEEWQDLTGLDGEEPKITDPEETKLKDRLPYLTETKQRLPGRKIPLVGGGRKRYKYGILYGGTEVGEMQISKKYDPRFHGIESEGDFVPGVPGIELGLDIGPSPSYSKFKRLSGELSQRRFEVSQEMEVARGVLIESLEKFDQDIEDWYNPTTENE